MQLIHLEARVPSRSVPSSGTLEGLKVDVTVYQVSPQGVRSIVPSGVIASGGGGDSKSEYVSFTLDIPVDPSERDAAIREFLADVARSAPSSPDERPRALAATPEAVGAFAQIFREHRVGRFHIECRVLDEGRVLGTGRVDLEVLFKGRFFDQKAFRRK